MRRRGIINAPLSGELARLGHTDLVVVADAGLPFPRTTPSVDLAIVLGQPRFVTVLDAVLDELVVEHAWVAGGADGTSAGRWVDARLPDRAERIDHDALKALTARAQLVIRTGETTAYANAVLRCGVPFSA